VLQIYQTGTEQFNLKPLRGITYLQEHELLSSPLDPKEVVRFIKENPKLDKKQIGEFISNKKYSAVLEEYQKYVTTCLNTFLQPYSLMQSPMQAPGSMAPFIHLLISALCVYCLLVYIVRFFTYPFFLLIFFFENRPAAFPGRRS